MKAIEQIVSKKRKAAVQTAVVLIICSVFVLWYLGIHQLPKLEYNMLHPYLGYVCLTRLLLTC